MERMSTEQLDTLRARLQQAQASCPRFVRIAPNTLGRDFVIGDVHGAFDLVWHAMRAAGFDRVFDRLFGVGDLVDRGAGSGRAGAFLAQPYVYSVMGTRLISATSTAMRTTPRKSSLLLLGATTTAWGGSPRRRRPRERRL